MHIYERVGCHFLLQCMKVKTEREVAQSCSTLRDPMDCSLPGSSIHGIFQARVLEWGAIAFSNIYIYIHTNVPYLYPFTCFLTISIYFWLCCLHCRIWAFSSCGAQAAHCGGFSCFRAWALGHAGFRRCGAWA